MNGRNSIALVLSAVAMLAATGCGKSSRSDSSGAGARHNEAGSDSGGSAGTSAGEGGNAGTGAGSAGQTAAGRGTSGGAGGEGASDAGAATGGAGTPATGGASTTGGAGSTTGGSAGSDGGAAQAGAASAGSPGTGGMATCSTGCELHESCWSDGAHARCIATPINSAAGRVIDVTEVTRGQYAAWLATEPAVTGQPEACAWNESFAPDRECMGKESVCQGSACATHPQPCVDLCDAVAYCAAIGARLCTGTEWLSACSSDGMYDAAYGPSFVSETCNDYTVYSETTVPVASKTGCRTPDDALFVGVFDLIGNVAEWVDDCDSDAGAGDVCNPRGLSFGIGAAAPLCDQATYAERSDTADNLGFRCCSGAP